MAGQFIQGAGGRFVGSRPGGAQPVPPAIRSGFAAEHLKTLSYDPKSNHGTGYGQKDGSSVVKLLQAALNRAGLVDLHGRPLAVDGKLGPLTTSAIKAAQQRLGITPADGVVTPRLLMKILGLPPKPAAKPKSTARHLMQTKPKPKARKVTPTPVRASTPSGHYAV